MISIVHKYQTDNHEINPVYTNGEIEEGKTLYRDEELTMPVNGFSQVNMYSYKAILDIQTGVITGLTIIK